MVNVIPWKSRGRNGGEPGGLMRLRNKMDRLFDRIFDTPFGMGGELIAPASWSPLLEVSDNDNEVVVCAEVPGMDANDINITVKGNELTISGEKKESVENKREGYYQSERRFGSFHRMIELPSEVDADKVSASYTNGVLELRIPKSPQQQPKRIPVKGGSRAGQSSQPSPKQGGQS